MIQTAASSTSSSRGDHSSHRQTFENLARELTAAETVLVSSLPRGGLQMVQPQRVSETLVKAYGREFQALDEVTWRAIIENAPVQASASGRYVREFLKSFTFQYAAAAPVHSLVFDGYPGAIQVIRTAEQGDFSESELRKLGDIARRLENTIAATRASRAGAADGPPLWERRPSTHVVIFDSEGKVRAFESAFEEFDERIRQQMKQEVRQRLARKSDEPVTRDRVLLPDANGDHLTFNVVVYRSYPALGTGPFVFFCLQPNCPEWANIRPSDFHADPEVARLIPAVKFMHQEFHRGPTLVEIAKTLHLSPFHFHRRFTELLGITPKHLLLECQIHEAKSQLIAGTKELSQIAADCGFAHQSHFTSRFKQATGLTPTRWRRMALQRMSSGGNAKGND
jgi:AraC-like DNA-binding protein